MTTDWPVIEGYEIEARLGQGGMATVYRARQLGLERTVAIKVLRADGPGADDLRRRFEQEARLIASLHHPGIVAIYEVLHTARGESCYVMPYLPHGDLSQRELPMPEAEARTLLVALLEALGHAHRAGIVHRDVKPENIVFGPEGQPLLADFGVARKLGSSRLTQHEAAIGSARYMSPEQARGADVDARSDLYSVGCLAFELLTGRPPFEGEDFLAVALKHQQDPIPPLPPALGHWRSWFDRALAKRPEQRFADAQEMARALPAAPSIAPPTPAATARWRGAWVAGALAALGTLAVFAGLRFGAEPARTPLPEIAALIEQGAVLPPTTPNALQALGPWLDQAHRPERADALLHQALAAGGRQVLERRGTERLTTLSAWVAALETHSGWSVPAVRSTLDELAAGWALDLALALERHDGREAERSLGELALLPEARRDPALVEQARRVGTLPRSGAVFRDAPGPALLLVPRGAVAGIERAVAIAVAPVSVEDYAEFLRQTRRSAGRCPGTTGSYADCLSYGDAQAYAAWVSEQTGARYRLPSLAEWRALVGWSPEGPRPEWPAVWEWTQSCELERVNPVGRAVSNVGRRLQGKPIDRRTHVCDGRYTVRPDQAPRAQDEEYAARGLGLRLLREY